MVGIASDALASMLVLRWNAQATRRVEPTERSVPVVKTEVLPELSVRRGREAVEFYKAALGAVEIYRLGGTEQNEDVVAQLSVGNASFWVSDESPAHKNFSPESLGGSTGWATPSVVFRKGRPQAVWRWERVGP